MERELYISTDPETGFQLVVERTTTHDATGQRRLEFRTVRDATSEDLWEFDSIPSLMDEAPTLGQSQRGLLWCPNVKPC